MAGEQSRHCLGIYDSVDWTGGQLITSFIVGGAGTSFISNLFREARVRSIDKVADTLGDVVDQNLRLQQQIDDLKKEIQGSKPDGQEIP